MEPLVYFGDSKYCQDEVIADEVIHSRHGEMSHFIKERKNKNFQSIKIDLIQN
jgi:hypothetical protein